MRPNAFRIYVIIICQPAKATQHARVDSWTSSHVQFVMGSKKCSNPGGAGRMDSDRGDVILENDDIRLKRKFALQRATQS